MARYRYWMVYLPEVNPSSFLLFVADSTGANKLRCYSSGKERILRQPGAPEIWRKTRQGITITCLETDPHQVSDVRYWYSKTLLFNKRLPPSPDLGSRPPPKNPAPAQNPQAREFVVRGRAAKGSRRQIQDFVNANPSALERAIVSQLPEAVQQLSPKIRWVSPLAAQDYREYRDAEFLQKIGVGHLAAQLRDFWPQRGPSWDALGIMSNAAEKPGVILVEAKSHIAEIYGNGCAASGRSREKILSSLHEVQRWCAAEPETDWVGPLYQSANRIAHLYFLLERADIPAWLVNIYFIDDPYRPTVLAEWQNAVQSVKIGLGLRTPIRNAIDLYLPAFSDS